MATYTENSAAALWQLIAIMGHSDGRFRRRDEMPEAKWSLDFVSDLFQDQLPVSLVQEIVARTIKEIDELDGPEQRETYLHQAAANITEPGLRQLALAILHNILLADGRVAEEEQWVYDNLVEYWGIGEAAAHAAKSIIPTLNDIPLPSED